MTQHREPEPPIQHEERWCRATSDHARQASAQSALNAQEARTFEGHISGVADEAYHRTLHREW